MRPGQANLAGFPTPTLSGNGGEEEEWRERQCQQAPGGVEMTNPNHWRGVC